MQFTYPKHEKLKSKTTIDLLFSEGNSVSKFPLRLVYVENIGYFIITKIEENGDGIEKYKNITADSLESEFNYKKVTKFKGPFKFYDLIIDPSSPALLNTLISYAPGWTIDYVDPALATLYRTFDISDSTIYNLLMTDVEEAYQCVFTFDSIAKTVSAYSTTTATTNTDIYMSYNNLIEEISINEVTEELVTAGVSVQNGKMILYYNEEFFNNLTWQERQGLLIHEFLHIIFNHTTSRAKILNGKLDRAWNFATDFAINSLIDEKRLPPGGLIPGKWTEIPEEYKHFYSEKTLNEINQFRDFVINLPKAESADWYYEQINKNRDVFESLLNGNIIGTADNHDGWSSEGTSSEEKEFIENNIRRIIQDSAEMCNRSNHWGSVSNEMQLKIFESIKV
jgi:hypothetical protein